MHTPAGYLGFRVAAEAGPRPHPLGCSCGLQPAPPEGHTAGQTERGRSKAARRRLSPNALRDRESLPCPTEERTNKKKEKKRRRRRRREREHTGDEDGRAGGGTCWGQLNREA